MRSRPSHTIVLTEVPFCDLIFIASVPLGGFRRPCRRPPRRKIFLLETLGPVAPNRAPPSIFLQFPHPSLRTPRPATEPRDGPTQNFHEKYRKNTPSPKFRTPRIYPQNTPKIPKKYRKNTEKIPPKYQKCPFGVFSRYFRGIFLGFQNFGAGGIFSIFFVEIPGRAISGLCSRSGRSQTHLRF